jgi:putative salt-induced outer membrane protein YdiY
MFDPTLPQENTLADAAQMRSQLNGLKALIDAILTISAAQVDTVNTLPPGNPATVDLSVSGNTLHFTFGIPQGNTGDAGPQGPAFANAVVDSVTTLNPSDPATVSVGFDGSNVHFTFAIPRGETGSQGQNGSDGPQGPPGEVSAAQLNTAIDGTSSNTNGVSTLGQTADGSYNPTQMQDLMNKVDELITALRR